MEAEPKWVTPLRYFFHGILFSIIYIGLVIFWALILAALVAFGFILGFAIGFVAFFYLLGGINVFLADSIWSIPIKDDWKSLLGHGFALSIALIIAHIPAIIINSIIPSLATTALMLFIYAFIDGLVATTVAGLWEEEREE